MSTIKKLKLASLVLGAAKAILAITILLKTPSYEDMQKITQGRKY